MSGLERFHIFSIYLNIGALDGKLYAVGGECETKFAHEGTLYLSSVEYYDPIHNEWSSVREMKHPRSFTAVAVLGSKSASGSMPGPTEG